MPNTVNVVPVIDTSYSMKASKYVDNTKRASEEFVSSCLPGDGLGVVNFDKEGHITYAFSTVDQNKSQPIAAAAKIEGLSFTGKRTAIGLGLQAAKEMLNSRANPRGIVLLSDGRNNEPPDPLSVLPSDYRVYTCAMGPDSDQNLLSEIARKTGGTPYYMPYPNTMSYIYNQIRGQQFFFARTVTNKIDDIKTRGYALIQTPISRGNSMAQFGVVWDDNSLSYTNSSNPSSSQISVTLADPNAPFPISPRIIGKGYVVFDIPNPRSGEWKVQVISGKKSPISVTSGAFEFPVNQEGAADLIVSAPASIRAGEPLSVQAHVVENGKPVQGLQVRAAVVQPTLSVSNVLAVYKDELEKVELTEEDLTDGMPEDLLRLAKLRTKLLSERDIPAHRSYALILREGLESRHGASLEDTSQAGSYNIEVVATGLSPETGTTFQRTSLVTVLVTD